MPNDPPAHASPALTPMHLAEAAVARLCHDLSGSLGAVMNGLELATSTTDGIAGEALALAADASAEVAARLRLARAIWSGEAPLTTAELPPLAEGLPNRARLRLDTANLAPGTFSPATARLALAALAMAADALHGPGTITLAGDPARELIIAIAGVRAAWPATLAALLATPDSALTCTPRHLYLGATLLLAPIAGAHLSMLFSTGPAAGPAPLLLRLA